ncbi:hypothetical protein BGX26_007996 [Mortierella sp. AD094]|nr:hypothetical protein BGX26_007996 [Mortierella sp. AD094]
MKTCIKSLDAKGIVLQGQSGLPVQAPSSLQYDKQNDLVNEVPHAPTVEPSNPPVGEEESELKIGMIGHIQEKLGSVVKATAPSLTEDGIMHDEVEGVESDVVVEEPIHHDDTILDAIVGSVLHDSPESTRPYIRRGDVVFENEDNRDGEHNYHHFQGEPPLSEDIKDKLADGAEKAVHTTATIFRFLSKLELVLPLDWDIDYLADDSDLKHVTDDESDENDEDQEKEKTREDDEEHIETTPEDDEEGQQHSDGIFSRVMDYLPTNKVKQELLQKRHDLEDAAHRAAEKVSQAKDAEKAKLAKLVSEKSKRVKGAKRIATEKMVKIRDDLTMKKRHEKVQSEGSPEQQSYEQTASAKAEALLKQLEADRKALEKERSLFEEKKRAEAETKQHTYEHTAAAKAEAMLKQLEADRIVLEKERSLFEEQKRADPSYKKAAAAN